MSRSARPAISKKKKFLQFLYDKNGTSYSLGTSAFTTSGLVNSDAVSAVTLKYSGSSTVAGTTNAATYTGGIIASAATGTGLSLITPLAMLQVIWWWLPKRLRLLPAHKIAPMAVRIHWEPVVSPPVV